MRFELKGFDLRGRWFDACRVATAIELSGDRQPGLSSGGANEVQNLLVAVEWFADPVLGDFRKEAVFDRVPFGGARRVVGDRQSQAELIGQLRLEFGFPGAATGAIAATGVAQNEELPGSWITGRSLLAPPMCDGMGRKSGCVVRDADRDRPSVGEQIIDAVRDGDAGGVGAEVVVVD